MASKPLTKTPLAKLLRDLDACVEAREWASGYSTLSAAWAACPRGDWLLWLAGHMIGQPGWPTHQQVVLAACDCAETALPFAGSARAAAEAAINAARRWAASEATRDEVRDAAYAAYRAGAGAAGAAAHAAGDVADAAHAYADYAAGAAAHAAATYAAGAARSKALAHCADLVRARLAVPQLEGEK